jgi:iron complex transport system ATP-binding protein
LAVAGLRGSKMLEVDQLSVSLGRNPLLHGIDLSARPGTLTAIVGPNGSGKTTLLRALTGDLPYLGEARLNGRDIRISDPATMASLRSVLSQSTQLAFPFTVLEVVRLGLPARNDALAMQALAEVGLAGFQGREMDTLSGGEQSRVHLARVLAQVWQPVGPDGARWLFLDEPVAALDIGHQLAVMRLARSYADAGGGVVAVMHDLNLSAMFADQMILLHSGRVLAQGRPDQVMTDDTLSRAYGCEVRVGRTPPSGPWVLPQATSTGLVAV